MEPPCEAQLLIDQRLSELQTELQKTSQKLRHQRNHYGSTAKLPPEILGNIFSAAAISSNDLYRASHHNFNFSYVSQRWRDIALSTPAIWGNFLNQSSKWKSVMLERSRMADLTFKASLNSARPERLQFLEEILKNQYHLPRLKELNITSCYQWGQQEIVDILPTSAPRLCIFSLHVCGCHPRINFPEGKLTDAPLKSLELKRCSFEWQNFGWTGLCDLCIFKCNNHTSSLSDCFDAISRMPRLENLELREVSFAGDTCDFHIPVVLASLRTFSFSSTLEKIIVLLRFLTVPKTTKVVFHCMRLATSQKPGREWSFLVSAVKKFFSSMIGGIPIYQELSLSKIDHNERYTISAWCSRDTYHHALETSVPGRHDPCCFSLILQGVSGYSLSKLLGVIPHAKIKALHFSASIPNTLLVPNFNDLAYLDTLVVGGDHEWVPGLVNLLGYRNKSKTHKNSRPKVLFPKLEHLMLVKMGFNNQAISSVDFLKFQNCLMERANYGVPVQKLTIWEPGVLHDEQVKKLQEIVVDVDWDLCRRIMGRRKG